MTTAHPPCVTCSKPIHRERGEREELWLSRKACSLPCRDVMRSRTQLAKAAERLARAVASWQPGMATSTHAQLHGLKHEGLKLALQAAGHRLAGGRLTVARLEKERRPKKKGGPPRDFLLEALQRVYGARTSARQPPLPARAA